MMRMQVVVMLNPRLPGLERYRDGGCELYSVITHPLPSPRLCPLPQGWTAGDDHTSSLPISLCTPFHNCSLVSSFLFFSPPSTLALHFLFRVILSFGSEACTGVFQASPSLSLPLIFSQYNWHCRIVYKRSGPATGV